MYYLSDNYFPIQYEMKLIQIPLLIFAFLIVVNCAKDEEPTPNPETEEKPISEVEEPQEPQELETEVYFTINTFANSLETNWASLDQWIIIHDSNGKLLDYKLYESGDNLEFEAPRDSLTPTINITYFRFTKDANDRINQELSTETGISKGSVETFGPYESNTIVTEKEGDFRVHINNIPNPNNTAYPHKVELSSDLGRLGSSGSGAADPFGIDLYFDISKYEGFSNFFVSVLDHNNVLKYHFFEQTSLESYFSDYETDFKVIEKDISLTLPSHRNYYLNIAGFEENQEFNQNGGYWVHEVISQITNTISTNPLRMGYPSIFPKYRTIFSIEMDGYSYVNAHYGKPLDAISIPGKPAFTIKNSSLNMFRFEVDMDYASVRHSWNYLENENQYSRTNWRVFADKGYDPVIGNLPEEILLKYPSLHIDLLEYKSTSLDLPLRDDAEFLSTHRLTIFN